MGDRAAQVKARGAAILALCREIEDHKLKPPTLPEGRDLIGVEHLGRTSWQHKKPKKSTVLKC